MTATHFPAQRAEATATGARDCGRSRLAGARDRVSVARALARGLAPGLAAAAGLGVVATVIGKSVPLAGSAMPGAVLGALIAITRSRGVRGDTPSAPPGEQRPAASLAPGLKFAGSRLLQVAVVLLGAQLSVAEAARVGLSSLPVMLGTLAACLGAAWAYGRLLGVAGGLRTLIGVGTGICGASAIAAASPVIEAASADIAYAVSTIFVFNIAAVLAFPVLGHALGMSQHSFGLFAGTAVNDTSSVVATATTYGSPAANQAVVVKLVRTLMIIPVCAGLAWLTARKRRAAGAAAAATAAGSGACSGRRPGRASRRALTLIPWFLIGFLAMAAANSAGLIPAGAHGGIAQVATFLVAVALSAIGLSTDVGALRRAGARPLLLGAMLWLTVAATSLALQALTGTLH
jgi:uncharacterized integral membrane protein (TIGR00698 family)